ncbi:MAG: hypothetical protein ABII85_05855 [Bacillota bacterium]
MMGYLYLHLFYSKKRTILILGLVLWIVMLMLLIYPNEPVVEQRLYQLQNQRYYVLMMSQLFTLIFPFFVVLVTMDHDQSHLKPMIGYFGRTWVILHKMIFYLIVITWLYFMFFMVYHILPTFLTAYYTFDLSLNLVFINLYLDGIIITLFVFIFIRDRHKALSVLIAVFYVLISWLQEDHPNLSLFYLFPLFSSLYSTFTLAYVYKVCYICLGLSIYIYQINFETI